ncbi:flavodoxin/nitric oxide synthase [Microlunatus sp. Gsoil 973]|uniref:flavodoxin family protein n=1 Tax=Microlunatus sp. Gsoil 973 TaxID=2672569 RepID=UPI0018A81CA0|nr:flavodoxin/nitric oxide synthase [Microlunatus sp. Gsoil 973]
MTQQSPTTLVVVESAFGNTRRIADAIAAGIGTRTAVIDIDEAPSTVPAGIDLLVIGGPTHALGMSRPQSRQDAQGQGGAASSRGIREWIAELTPQPGCRVVTFDTKSGSLRRLAGSAANRAARKLRGNGFALAARPMSFYVADLKGPLLDGEIERATAWGRDLAAKVGVPPDTPAADAPAPNPSATRSDR